MVLTIPFHDFAFEARERFVGEPIFLVGIQNRTLVSVSNGKQDGTILQAWSQEHSLAVKTKLELAGFKVREGRWSESESDEGSSGAGSNLHVYAIAYKSENGSPGLWIDAGFDSKSEAETMRNFFDELRDNEEITKVSFEEFVRLADAKVMVFTPSELHDFALDEKHRNTV